MTDESGILNPPNRQTLRESNTIKPFGNATWGATKTKTKTEIKFPSMILVCNDCNEYYEDESEWAYCPKCSSELHEVEQA